MDYSIKLLSDKARYMNGKTMENILKSVNVEKLKDKIQTFQNTTVQGLSDKELEANIDEVLSVKLDGGIAISTTLSEYSLFRKGVRFYRVRKLKNSDMPNCDLENVTSYWNPPPEYVKKYGRLNKPGESLLYTALNPYTAMCETNLEAGNSFALCVYEAMEPLRFSWIGGKANYRFNGITNKRVIEVYETIRQFLIDEFTQVIPEGQESLYRITETIAKKYYASPDDHGWRYPSIKNNFEDNVCFRSERVKDNIRLVGAIIATFNESNETDPHEIKMSVEYIVVGPDMDNYYPYESERGEIYMKKLFPEFVQERPANS